jgi:hypothetical protein
LNSQQKQAELTRNGGEKWPIPTSASNSNDLFLKELQIPETASASESASESITGAPLSDYPGTTRQPLAMAGFAARRV